MEKIKNKYPNITLTDAEIISSYTYEFEKEDNQYCPYRLLNRNLVNDNRKEGINNISKYLYILLYSLRKLTRYYPKEKSKYLYRCIPSNINLNDDQFNKKIVPYIIGNKKNFWGFTSTSPNIQTTYEFLGKNKGNKKGTIFTLTGKVWGYDISVFNICREEEVLLEPERKFLIDEVIPPINDIIHVRCEILDTPLVLDKNLTSDVITIRYLINENDKKVKIFGEQFVQNNRGYFSDKCDILFQEKKYRISCYFNINNFVINNILEIKLRGISKVTDMSHLFDGCEALKDIEDIALWNTKEVIYMNSIFKGCKNLRSLPDISKWNTSKVKNMSNIFSECSSLLSLPDISKWNTSNVKNMDSLFKGCSSLSKLPDISEWNTSNVKYMDSLFKGCSSLQKLPDISEWDVINVLYFNNMFDECKSLKSLPDISKWKFKKEDFMIIMDPLNGLTYEDIINMRFLFNDCFALLNLPDISKWDTSFVKNMANMFNGCSSLKSLPDISKWNTSKVEAMENMFNNCSSLNSLPDISKWNTSNVISMENMFNKCNNLQNIPILKKKEKQEQPICFIL